MDIKPDFYEEFKCIADRCSMTCCMQWKVAVDERTLAKWRKTTLGGKSLDVNVKKNGSEGIIKLNKNGCCPYLQEGLCGLVTDFGEDMLSETCHVFPREVHEFEDRRELSLVSCCPEVIDFLYKSDALVIENLDKISGDLCFEIRNLMMRIIGNREYDVNSVLLMAFYILLDIYEKDEITPDAIRAYESADNLKEIYHAISELTSDEGDCLRENNELWLDIAYNYRKEGLYTEYIEAVSCQAENILEENTDMHMDEFKEAVSTYENLFRNYLLSEIFTNMLIPDSDLEAMVVMFQWICMEYTVIRQGIFLKWLSNYKRNADHSLSYHTVRDYMVVIARMTGYDQDDIYEYMEDSFRDIMWEWSYLWLIMGGFISKYAGRIRPASLQSDTSHP